MMTITMMMMDDDDNDLTYLKDDDTAFVIVIWKMTKNNHSEPEKIIHSRSCRLTTMLARNELPKNTTLNFGYCTLLLSYGPRIALSTDGPAQSVHHE